MSKRVSVSEAIEFRRAIKASDVLLERAVQCAVDEASGDARMMGALADLLEVTAAYIAWTEGAGRGESGHDIWLLMRNALAAAERAITGETK